ncbi:hypothetical protein [Sphingomonas xanthus]|nr:hypothetical protein [Sphingomonas xanthus]
MTALIALLLAGCAAEPASGPTNDAAANDAAEAAAAPAEVPALDGSWAVTASSVGPAAQSLGMTAAFANGTATFSVGCLRRAWSYNQQRNSVAFTPSPGGSSNCGGTPSADAEFVFAQLGDMNIAVFANEGRQANLSGTSGTITLERR